MLDTAVSVTVCNCTILVSSHSACVPSVTAATAAASACADCAVSINGQRSQVSPAVRNAVHLHLDRLCNMLLTGNAGPKAERPEAAAIGAAALAFFRNRASAPRDMSAAATVQFRAACDAVLADIY